MLDCLSLDYSIHNTMVSDVGFLYMTKEASVLPRKDIEVFSPVTLPNQIFLFSACGFDNSDVSWITPAELSYMIGWRLYQH